MPRHRPRPRPKPAQKSGTDPNLNHTLQLLQLLVRRNRNQHRAQSFWKPLSMLKRALTRFLRLQEVPRATTAEAVRARFEQEAHRDILAEYIREELVARCYVAFSALVGDGQFAGLGVVLMGVLGRVAGCLGVMRGDAMVRDEAVSVTRDERVEGVPVARESVGGVSSRVTGQVVENVHALSHSRAVEEKQSEIRDRVQTKREPVDGASHKKEKGSKKKKGKSAIDDLFAGLE